MEKTDPQTAFIAAAERYCSWCENANLSRPRSTLLRELGVLLADVFAAGMMLPLEEDDAPGRPHESHRIGKWQPAIREVFAMKYTVLVDPVDSTTLVTQVLWDDIISVYAELACFLERDDYEATIEAAWDFHTHTAQHCAGAMTAIPPLLEAARRADEPA